ncbi:MAG: methylmalonyl-CoA epimerase [Bacteroidetes bacterium]|nr:MAG: methylmalonyl-CoA epimerase [Bacteroidota bacterium]
MNKIEHIGIAVRDLENANQIFQDILNTPSYKSESVKSEGVKTSFFKVGPNKIELLQATNPDSPIAKFIEKRGEGIHHIAFAVDNVEEEIKRLTSKGYRLINQSPKTGADNKLIAFLHPKSSNEVLIELCQDIDA